jgi:hypothetical protein
MPERSACDNSMETGAPIAGEDGVARYVRSIAELHDDEGTLVGWIYLATDVKGGKAEYVQGKREMSPPDRTVLKIRLTTNDRSSVALLTSALPGKLTPAKCSASRNGRDAAASAKTID